MKIRTIVISCCLLLRGAPSFAQIGPKPANAIRVATFNASLNRDSQGQLVRDLSDGKNVQARNVAEVIQRVRPDIILINEFDDDRAGVAADSFRKNYLEVAQNGAEAIHYPDHFSAEVNTGMPSKTDLDGDGRVVNEPGSRGYGNDAIGFGQFPGQYGLVVYSMYPIGKDVRQFHRLLWKDMPGALLPTKADGSPWYSPESLDVLRLSSKSHWDVPISIEGKEIHLLVSHPTPPAFDGPEDRNGKRNHDEIRLWADYLTGGGAAGYLKKALPAGSSIEPPESFIILGDQNADPVDGGSQPGAIDQLLRHPKVNASFVPKSAGAAEASRSQGGRNQRHKGDADADTADFADGSVGNLRVDYVLPSKNYEILGGGVFWPTQDDPLARLVKMSPAATSDHRLVFIDLK